MIIRKFVPLTALSFALLSVACDDPEPRLQEDGGQPGALPLPDGGRPLADAPVIQPDGAPAGDASLPSGDASLPSGDASLPSGDASLPSGDAGMPSRDGGNEAVPGAKFFLPTGEPDNTSAPSVELDAAGNTHSVYPAYAGGGAYYGFCSAADCDSQADVQVVSFETQGTVANAMLVLTTDGKPRILLSSYQKVYWGSCEQNCGQRASWQFAEILDHGSDRAITGEALALDPAGRPRFLMHAYKALFGIGQKTPETLLAQCDATCESPASWRYDVIAKDEIWEGSTLRYDATGRAHVATTLHSYGENAGKPSLGAYLSCQGACNSLDTWSGIGFAEPFESMTEVVDMHPAISLALTKAGAPRIAQLAKTPEGKKRIVYFECDADCQKDNWRGIGIFESDALNAGLDLALDAQDRPRVAHTINYNIALTYCESAACTQMDSPWDSSFVEEGGDIPADRIFLEWNCTIGAWFLHSPSIALDAAGRPRVGYQARDVSGGVSQPDPTKPSCVAGTDMTWSRLALMNATK